jgi:hypothetical protein
MIYIISGSLLCTFYIYNNLPVEEKSKQIIKYIIQNLNKEKTFGITINGLIYDYLKHFNTDILDNYIKSLENTNNITLSIIIKTYNNYLGYRYNCKLDLPDFKYYIIKIIEFLKHTINIKGMTKISKIFFEGCLNNRDLMLPILNIYGYALSYVTNNNILSDRECVLAAVSNTGTVLKYANSSLHNDKEIVFKAVENIGTAYKYASYEMRENKDLAKIAIEYEGHIIEYASKNILEDRNLILMAVARSGTALQYAYKFQDDRKVVLAAVKNNGYAWRYANKNLQNDIEIVKIAVITSIFALKYVNINFLKDR